jgi:hypothetical protein
MKSPVAGWTDAKFKGWIVSLLRRGTMRFPPRNDALRAAKTEKKINVKTGRMAQHYKCVGCNEEFTAKGVVVDHIEPVIPVGVGFTTWDEYIERMFCPVDNLQVLCGICHDVKSKEERQQRKIK